MSGRLKKAAIVLGIAFVAAQFVRPNRTNPPTQQNLTFRAQPGTSSELSAILDRACRDCHSNETVWPWYSQIAPASWLMQLGVKEGREAVNFSEWAKYPPGQQRALLALSCHDVTVGKMPGPYTLLRPETALSAADVETICATTRPASAETPHGR